MNGPFRKRTLYSGLTGLGLLGGYSLGHYRLTSRFGLWSRTHWLGCYSGATWGLLAHATDSGSGNARNGFGLWAALTGASRGPTDSTASLGPYSRAGPTGGYWVPTGSPYGFGIWSRTHRLWAYWGEDYWPALQIRALAMHSLAGAVPSIATKKTCQEEHAIRRWPMFLHF